MKLIARTLLITIFSIAFFTGYSSDDWQSVMVVLIISGFLLLLSFITSKSNSGTTGYSGGASYSDNSCSGSDSSCGGD
jgi:hypothetical protein